MPLIQAARTRTPLMARISPACLAVLAAATLEARAADADIRPRPEPPTQPRFLEPREAPFRLPPLEDEAPSRRPGTGPQVQVDRVVFSGNTVIATPELAAVAAPYLGRRLGEAEIEDLRRALTQYYIDRGYVNSGAVLDPDAAPRDGVLGFRIVEGRISRFQIRGLERLRESYVSGRLAPREGEPLNLDTLRERFQILLDDPLFARINTRLMPGEAPGEAILDLEVARNRPYQMTLFTNNYRPPSVGEVAAGLSGNVRNLSGYGDFLEMRYQESTQGVPSPSSSLAWRVPVNRYGTTVWLRADHGQSVVIEAPLNALNITSRINSKEIGLSHPFIETLRNKLVLGLARVEHTLTSILLGEGFSFTPGVPAGRTTARLWRFWQEYAFRSEANAIVLRSTFSSENNNNLPAAGAASIQAPPRYQYWLGQFQYAQRLGDAGIQTVLKGAVQHAAIRLLPIDSMAIGGVNTVRGYRENQILGDKGEQLSLQLDVPLSAGVSALPRFVASPFFDWGRVRNIGYAPNILSSLGLALKAEWKGARLEIAAAKRLIHDPAVDALRGSRQDQRIHVQLSYDFF